MAKSRDQYFVVLHDSQWKIKLAGKYYGPYRTQADAIVEAVSTAKKMWRKVTTLRFSFRERTIDGGRNTPTGMIPGRHQADRMAGFSSSIGSTI